MLREADPVFVKNLKEKMLSDPSAPGSMPMAVLVKDMDGIGEFNENYRNVYKYEVLGGLHTMVAKQQLSEEYPENPFFSSWFWLTYMLDYLTKNHCDWHNFTLCTQGHTQGYG